MIRRGTVALLLAVSACTGTTQESPSTTSAVPPTTTTTSAPTDPGRLAVLTDSGDVVVMRPDGSDRQEITDDAGVSTAYAQPVWSPDGRSLAWGQASDSGFAVGIRDLAAAETTTVATTNLPFYVSWSPDGNTLGILHNGTDGVAFGLVDVGTGALRSVDEDAPFYFSWSPSGGELVTHAGADRVELVGREGDTTPLDPTGPDYLSPQWTSEGVLHVADGALLLESDDGRDEVAYVDGLVMFVANRQGTKVAVQTTGIGAVSVALDDPPELPGSSVIVVDLATGETSRVVGELALGFFWAPDGDKLLVLTSTGNEVVPVVWAGDGSLDQFPGYRPPSTMLQDTFPFFPQYAQSVTFWAPDSSAFAYAGQGGTGEGVWVQPLDAAEPELVSDGRWVAWSAPQG